jgi:hypothetical protein
MFEINDIKLNIIKRSFLVCSHYFVKCIKVPLGQEKNLPVSVSIFEKKGDRQNFFQILFKFLPTGYVIQDNDLVFIMQCLSKNCNKKLRVGV